MYTDSKLTTFFQRYLKRTNQSFDLRNLAFCGSQASSRLVGGKPAVFVVTNNEKSRYVGLNTCHSIWSCPRCTPIVMARKGEEIACAIEALRRWHNQLAIMITFTLPHTKGMTCKETFDILLNTWRKFSHGGNTARVKKKYTRIKDGSTVTYNMRASVYGRFRGELGIRHNIRIYEFTHGKNSWHPHIHALFWVPKENLSHVLEYEDELLDLWWHCAKTEARKYYKTKYPHNPELVNQIIETRYADWRKKPSDGMTTHKSLWISKNPDGTPHVMKSSYYVSGWTGNFEMTAQQLKQGKHGHRTPFQILEDAYKATDEAKRNELLELYTEYALATYRHTRSFWSARSGVKDIIRRWRQTRDYIVSCKKKAADKVAETGRWKVVCWFSELQWFCISETDRTPETAGYLRARILELARLPDAVKQITELLLPHGIDIRDNGQHPKTNELENSLYNNVIAEDLVA